MVRLFWAGKIPCPRLFPSTDTDSQESSRAKTSRCIGAFASGDTSLLVSPPCCGFSGVGPGDFDAAFGISGLPGFVASAAGAAVPFWEIVDDVAGVTDGCCSDGGDV